MMLTPANDEMFHVEDGSVIFLKTEEKKKKDVFL